MNIFSKKPKFNETKEYLEKQQKIDLLIVLTRITEPMLQIPASAVSTASKKIEKILDEL